MLWSKLFTVDGTYHEMPFDEPMFGADAIRQYWTEGAKDSQESISSHLFRCRDRNDGFRKVECLIRPCSRRSTSRD